MYFMPLVHHVYMIHALHVFYVWWAWFMPYVYSCALHPMCIQMHTSCFTCIHVYDVMVFMRVLLLKVLVLCQMCFPHMCFSCITVFYASKLMPRVLTNTYMDASNLYIFICLLHRNENANEWDSIKAHKVHLNPFICNNYPSRFRDSLLKRKPF